MVVYHAQMDSRKLQEVLTNDGHINADYDNVLPGVSPRSNAKEEQNIGTR